MVNNKYISLEKKKDIYSNKLKKAEKKKSKKKNEMRLLLFLNFKQKKRI
jgi:hypothetical protein